MFVLITLTIPRSLLLAEYESLTALLVETEVWGSLLFGSVTRYVIDRC